jgi:NADH-quinone oxidoreductase chain G
MMVRITINGQKALVDASMTVLDAARKTGTYVPTFCDQARLSKLGACRMCLVEVEGMGKLQTACTLAVAEGMVVKTDTPRVEKARKAMLEFLLINHPLECTVCDASGECTLQDFAFKYGSAETRFTEKKRVLRDTIISPLIDRNLNRCIQCKRCVRICDEVQGVTALGMSYRGAATVVGPFMDKSLDCEFCGHCIWTCPVGAITSKVAKHKVRTWELDKAEAICPYCSCGCTLVYNHRDNFIFKVTHAEGRGTNHGSLCSRGYFGYDAITSPDRITAPMIRRDGELVPTTWEEAMSVLVKGLSEAAESGGENTIGGIVSSRLTNEEYYLFQKLFRTSLGSNSIDVVTGHWNRTVLPVLEGRLGVFASPNAMDELNYVDALLIVGCDITVDNPIAGLKVKSAIQKGAGVTEISSKRTALSRMTARTLLVEPGGELAVVKGMIRVILEEGLAGPEVLEGYKRLDDLRMSVLDRDLKTVAEKTGIDENQITSMAREFISAHKASIVFGEAAAMGPDGPMLINALIDLLMLTGKLGQEGCGLYPIQPGTNFQGAVDMGISPQHLPGHLLLSDKQNRGRLEKSWKVKLPAKEGLTAPDILKTASDGKLKALYVVGADLATTFPGSKAVDEALSKVSFLVVQDIFLNDTAKKAHVVLPAGTLAEKNGTLTNMERRIQRTRKAIDGRGKSMPDWRIFSELGVALGQAGMKYINAAEVLDELAANVPFYSGINHRILADNGLQWPFTEKDAKEIYHDGYLGTRQLLAEGLPEELRSFSADPSWGGDNPDERYPMTLVTGDLLNHSGTFTRHSNSLNQLVSGGSLFMNPDTGSAIGIPDGGDAKVVSAHGKLTVKAEYLEDMLPGVFFLPRHFADTPVGRLMGAGGDRPETAVVHVRVEKA